MRLVFRLVSVSIGHVFRWSNNNTEWYVDIQMPAKPRYHLRQIDRFNDRFDYCTLLVENSGVRCITMY